MYFNKYLYSSNFEFVQKAEYAPEPQLSEETGSLTTADFQPHETNPMGSKQVDFTLTRHGNDVYSLYFKGPGWEKNYAQNFLDFEAAADGNSSSSKLNLADDMSLTLSDDSGNVLLQSANFAAFGISGNAAMYQFARSDDMRFYGMGEKLLGLELSGKKTKFWNTDAWGDFPLSHVFNERPDPLYVSVPYMIIKTGKSYVGLLLDNPFPTFMSTDNRVVIANQKEADQQPQPSIVLGSEQGQPNLIIICGPSLPELTRKLQKLVGVTPRPPAWSLGYHQCRWGYKSVEDLRYIAAGMDKYEIPCDGIWLDIEYMDGYRVFTYDNKHFPDPKKNLEEIHATGRRVVPIIDPGVKAEPGYEVYESGKEAGVYCLNPQGKEYIGLVWPGETVFPDYSTEEGRKWWSAQVQKFAGTGITSAWLDMNDPSTGASLCTEMLFDKGRASHESYHNQFALGMAQASRDGFLAERPDERPFMLCRSGFTGTSRYTAIWTGDNVSNYHYLKGSIACTLNLALSGIPFNGPDVCGFGANTYATLVRDWIRAGFLFPVLRNHTELRAEDQEPWVFDKLTLKTYRHYVQLRYKLRPYLYNLFVAQEEQGEAIMRPLFYDFSNTANITLDRIDDQFLVGPSIMQAPFVEENQTERNVVLPDGKWYDTTQSCWISGDRTITVAKKEHLTPLYIREGAIIPMARNEGSDFSFNSKEVDFALFLPEKGSFKSSYTYTYDDGISYEYQKGKQSRLSITANTENGKLAIATSLDENGYGDCDCGFIICGDFSEITLNGSPVKTKPFEMEFSGKLQTFYKISK